MRSEISPFGERMTCRPGTRPWSSSAMSSTCRESNAPFESESTEPVWLVSGRVLSADMLRGAGCVAGAGVWLQADSRYGPEQSAATAAHLHIMPPSAPGARPCRIHECDTGEDQSGLVPRILLQIGVRVDRIGGYRKNSTEV